MITALLFKNDPKVEISHIKETLSKLLIDSDNIDNQDDKEDYKQNCTKVKTRWKALKIDNLSLHDYMV